MADPTIYSFAWPQSNSENPQDLSNHSIMSTSGVSSSAVAGGTRASSKADENAGDVRFLPPTLPRPIYWTSLTHPDIFKEYINAEGLAPRSSNLNGLSVAPEDETWEPFNKTYANIQHITLANTRRSKIVQDCPASWINDHLFADFGLLKPFNPHLVSGDMTLWCPKPKEGSGYTYQTFRTLPTITNEQEAMTWLNYMGRSLGIVHGLVVPSTPTAIDPTDQVIKPGCADRAFDCEGHSKLLTKGLIQQKPDLVLIDRIYRDHVHTGVRLRWPLVQALVEITVKDGAYHYLINMLLEKASNVFDSQLHRRYILGLGIFGKGDEMKFFFTLIDRVGAASTTPSQIEGYNALFLARIIYAFTFGSDKLLGMDTRVTIDRFTGNPLSVLIDKQVFTIITEIHSSPYLFGRGTRVYIVKDNHGHFHILKDSWISSTHEGSEIDHIKKISDMAQTEGLSECLQILSPRFVAGEDHVDNTDEPRGLLDSLAPARIRRRIVTGPIGDPITSYRSRVECLQALIDVVDQLSFINDKCDLVHGIISISNIIIVRFLPSILAALDVAAPRLPSPTAGEQLVDSPSSSSGKSPITTTVNPSVGNPCSSTEGNPLNMTWEMVQPCTSTGFPHQLDSGGSVIDFDYSRPRNKLSAKTSGTMPYMAIELMKPLQPIEQRLEHDLESVCLVLLHIARFTCGPAGNPIGKVKLSHRISQWHHEPVVELMRDVKKLDIFEIREDPNEFITEYWAPIAPYITKLLDVVYPELSHLFSIKSGQATYKGVREVLVAALDHCNTLPENVPNYAAFLPSKKRSRPKSMAEDRMGQKHRRLFTADPYTGAHVPTYSQFNDSASTSGV